MTAATSTRLEGRHAVVAVTRETATRRGSSYAVFVIIGTAKSGGNTYQATLPVCTCDRPACTCRRISRAHGLAYCHGTSAALHVEQAVVLAKEILRTYGAGCRAHQPDPPGLPRTALLRIRTRIAQGGHWTPSYRMPA